jgi:hypothetical protein
MRVKSVRTALQNQVDTAPHTTYIKYNHNWTQQCQDGATDVQKSNLLEITLDATQRNLRMLGQHRANRRCQRRAACIALPAVQMREGKLRLRHDVKAVPGLSTVVTQSRIAAL